MPHVFAMDNLDRRKETLEGGRFNLTPAIIIENPDSADHDQHTKAITIFTSISDQQNTIHSCPSASMPTILQKINRCPGPLVISWMLTKPS